ncbi:MAG: lipase family protein [Candidatus Cyclobacteriaceae bacterium M2_1C_046]
MKSFLFSFLILLSYSSWSQVKEGFDKEEVKDLIAICNSFTFIDLYQSDEEILPEGYEKRYTSGTFGMDNKYQIYIKGKTAVINFRGSTDKKISWMGNIYSSMIPAKGVIKVQGETFNYMFARNKAAAVHSGYALALAYLSKDVLYHINSLNREGVFDIIITGHSQGGALANLITAYLHHLPEKVLSKKNKIKTYAFAAPMVGNKEFAEEYKEEFCTKNISFNIVNPADPIPTFPLSYNEENFVEETIKNVLFNKEAIDKKRILANGAAILFEKPLNKYAQKLSQSVEEQIAKELGPVEMPQYVEGINYSQLDNLIMLIPVEFPRFLKDSTILQNDSLMAVYKRDDEGYFINEEVYAKQSWTYQHKPYNYYVSVLKVFFPEQYATLEKKYLQENL